ncbi:MAG: ISNCY family transposase [Gammaproteobacteria bacterium]|nr:ISNCY family transposase [Gammaproteobacteria bacterium]
MRETRTAQASIFDLYAQHEIGRELEAISDTLDGLPELLSLIAADIFEEETKETGRTGMSAESVLRCALLKQHRQLSYQALAFHVEDSSSYRSFARLPSGLVPRKSALQLNISRIKAETWELVNQAIVRQALGDKWENCEMVRVDSTVVDADIHDPSDSSLLNDGIRVLTRLLVTAKTKLGVSTIRCNDQRKRSKRLAREIFYVRGKDKKKALYIELLAIVEALMSEVNDTVWQVELMALGESQSMKWLEKVRYYQSLLQRVVTQTERRVLHDEKLAPSEKIVSLFESHTDIIVKGNRKIQYGHKLNVTTGRKGIILDAVVESGNPCDSACFVPMLTRQMAFYKAKPGAIAADGGYASLANLEAANILGLEDVAFQKKKGLTIEAMASDEDRYRELCNFRAGIESNISELKRAYGLTRALWKGLEGFKACVWSAIGCYNLVKLVRLKLQPT